MGALPRVIIKLSIFIKICQSAELFNEKAWMDNAGRDKYFDYSEHPGNYINYSNNVDVAQFDGTTHKLEHDEHPKKQNLQSNLIDYFVKTIKKVVKPKNNRHYNKNETSKGLDIRLTSNVDVVPALGNNQDYQFIFLGTKWCGSGDIARNYQDVGYFYLTDNCCREHDSCPQNIEAQESKYGLINSGKFTRTHCDCDQKFYQCLKRVDTLVSKQIGIIYFNVLGHQCFREEFPIVGCERQVKGRCVKYKTELNKQRSYHWIDNPWF